MIFPLNSYYNLIFIQKYYCGDNYIFDFWKNIDYLMKIMFSANES